MPLVWYNEFDPYAAAWLRELAAHDHVPAGTVDTRSIADVAPEDLDGVTQAHFFAGIGGWPLALRLAGWPDDRPVWTGSCPCQPFSSAGKGGGAADERHLWPVWYGLIRECRPPTIFGEQVASKAGRAWFDAVSTDLEALGYAVAAADLCAAGVGAPHIRQRLFWCAVRVADAHQQRQREARSGVEGARATGSGAALGMGDADGPERRPAQGRTDGRTDGRDDAGWRGKDGSMADADEHGRGRRGPRAPEAAPDRDEGTGRQRQRVRTDARPGGAAVLYVGAPDEPRPQGRHERGDGTDERTAGQAGVAGADGRGAHGMADAEKRGRGSGRPGGASLWGPQEPYRHGMHDPWLSVTWLPCTDGVARPAQPGTFPLAHGLPRSVGRAEPELRRLAEVAGLDGQSLKRAKRNRTGRLRGYGNAIVPQVAAVFVRAAMDSMGEEGRT